MSHWWDVFPLIENLGSKWSPFTTLYIFLFIFFWFLRSVGCTVMEMATRKPPWADMPPMSAIFAIGAGGPVPQLDGKFSSDARDFVSLCLTRWVKLSVQWVVHKNMRMVSQLLRWLSWWYHDLSDEYRDVLATSHVNTEIFFSWIFCGKEIIKVYLQEISANQF